MTQDARFEDGAEHPLRLKALEPEDLEVLSALVQDAIFPGNEMTYQAANRRFAILLNRFRWEDDARSRHGPERVQSMLVIEDVMRVQTAGVRKESETILSVLSVTFAAKEDGAGRLEITLAGDGAIGLDVEALEVTLQDVTRPYQAPSGAVPDHPE